VVIQPDLLVLLETSQRYTERDGLSSDGGAESDQIGRNDQGKSRVLIWSHLIFFLHLLGPTARPPERNLCYHRASSSSIRLECHRC